MEVTKFGSRLVLMMLGQGVSRHICTFTLLQYIQLLGEDTKDKGKLYKPQSRISTTHETMSSAEKAQAYAKLLSTEKKPERLGKKKPPTKSNLEAFKEELRQYVFKPSNDYCSIYT